MDETTAAHLGSLGDVGRGSRRDGGRTGAGGGRRAPPGVPLGRVLWVPGGNHGVDIANLSPADRAWAEEALSRWAGQE
ncbi:hypothetical protein [Streptomyces chartreusis]|uniref:hypothetical protein n=1 Tax=Streptomyces chartreusis TaxID=1969 RepID=UPI0033B04798